MKKYTLEILLDEEDENFIQKRAKDANTTVEGMLRCLLGVSIIDEKRIFGYQTERKE